jgi:precorrin-4/cobalt-precorrin-4 C11-methyltransferase
LAVQRIAELVPELVSHDRADCPVAVAARASRDDELIPRGTLAGIAAQVEEAGVRRTAVVIVDAVLTAGQFSDSDLTQSRAAVPTRAVSMPGRRA